MNPQTYIAAEKIIPPSYLQQALNAKKIRENTIRTFIEQRKWPEEGWDDTTIELFLNDLALMDSNNFAGICCVGERDARMSSDIVAKRHYRLGHGIGRAGDIGEVQPRAAGSSLMTKLTNALLLDAIRFMGVKSSAGCFLAPMGTGMSLVLCMLTIKQDRPGAKFVLWSRIDQKSCFKSIITAGLQPIIVEPLVSGDELRTDIQSMDLQINTLGSSNIVCILSTTSSLAPKASDSLEHVAALCSRHNIPHLVNNSFGLQSARLMHMIQEAGRKGRVDAFVQSADKNFMVPVGGSIISGFDIKLLEKILKNYPGRACASPVMDVFITLLSLGSSGYKNLIYERKEMFKYLKDELGKVAAKYGERILDTRNNPISIAMTLSSISDGDKKRLALFGPMLYMRDISGARLVTGQEHIDISGYNFTSWGAHHTTLACPYVTASACIGMKKKDVDLFIQRLEGILVKLKMKANPASMISPDDVRRSQVQNDVSEEGDGQDRSGSTMISSMRQIH